VRNRLFAKVLQIRRTNRKKSNNSGKSSVQGVPTIACRTWSVRAIRDCQSLRSWRI